MKNCREVGPGHGLCIKCAQGLYEECLYVAASRRRVSDDETEELAHLALCAWNGWEPSEQTRHIFTTIWEREAPYSREAWKRVVTAVVGGLVT